MLKKIFAGILIFASAYLSFAQSPTIRMGLLKGVTSIPAAFLMENQPKLAVQDMTFTVYDSVQSELAAFLREEIDTAFISLEDGAKVCNLNEEKYVILGITQNLSLYLVSDDNSCKSIQDLNEKKILVTSKDSYPIKIFSYLFSKNKIEDNSSPAQVIFDDSLPAAQIPSKLITGQENYALLEEPFAGVTLRNSKKMKRQINLQKVYLENQENMICPHIVLLSHAEFAEKNRAMFTRFFSEYRRAVMWTNRNPLGAGLLAEKHQLGLSASLVKEVIPYSSFVWTGAKENRAQIEKALNIFLESAPSSIGGKLPADEVYY